MNSIKTIVITGLIIATIGWLGSPWTLHDEPECNTDMLTKGINCGGKSTFHRPLKQHINNAHLHLIRTVVGKKPVMMNMMVVTPPTCHTAMIIRGMGGMFVSSNLFSNDRQGDEFCPVYSSLFEAERTPYSHDEK